MVRQEAAAFFYAVVVLEVARGSPEGCDELERFAAGGGFLFHCLEIGRLLGKTALIVIGRIIFVAYDCKTEVVYNPVEKRLVEERPALPPDVHCAVGAEPVYGLVNDVLVDRDLYWRGGFSANSRPDCERQRDEYTSNDSYVSQQHNAISLIIRSAGVVRIPAFRRHHSDSPARMQESYCIETLPGCSGCLPSEPADELGKAGVDVGFRPVAEVAGGPGDICIRAVDVARLKRQVLYDGLFA